MKKSKAQCSHTCYSQRYERTPEEREQSFRPHLTSYIWVIAFLWVIWFFTGARYMWPIYPMMGWGIGLFFHALATYLSRSSGNRKAHNRENEFI